MKESVTDQLMVVLESPSIPDFDPAPAIHLWNVGGVKPRRMPGYKPRAVSASLGDSDCESSGDSSSSDSGSECEVMSVGPDSEPEDFVAAAGQPENTGPVVGQGSHSGSEPEPEDTMEQTKSVPLAELAQQDTTEMEM